MNFSNSLAKVIQEDMFTFPETIKLADIMLKLKLLHYTTWWITAVAAIPFT